MKIKKANLTDAKGISKVHIDSWRTTYKGIVPDDYLENLSYDKRIELWKRNISDKANYIVIAVTDEGQTVGFATGRKRETNELENSSDLTSIYLLEDHQGEGIGKKLLKEVFQHFKHIGYEKVFVEVLEDNQTRYFYERYGAKLVEKDQIEISGQPLNELIYVWDNVDKVLEKV